MDNTANYKKNNNNNHDNHEKVALDWLCVAIWYSLRGERRFSWQRCVLGMFVFTTWHVFPLICVIVWLDLVDDSGEFRLYAFADILAKVLITTTMLQGHVKVASDTLVLDYKIVHAEHEIMQDDMIEMISASPVPIIVTNSLGKITVWNRQAATVSRLKANAAEGVIIWDLPSLDPASGTSAYAAIQKVLKPNIGDKQHCITVTFELRFDHSTSDSSLSALGPSSTGISPVPGSHLNTKGRDRVTRTPTTVLLVTASATRNAAGEVVGIICLCADMTAECERLLAETSRAQVEAVNDAKDKFLACMSHEMRTPLSALIGLLQLVNAKPEPDWTHAVLHPFILSSLRSAEHLHVLVSDVLDMSKVSQGKLSLIIREFDLLETLESIADRCRHVLAQVGAGKRQLELEVRTDPDLSLAGSLRVLRGDAQRIQQVLTNLGSNAIKYTMRGSVEIHVIVRPLNEEELDEEEKMVAEAASYAPRECVPVELCVRVKDTGIGIPKHALKRIFDLFETASGEFFTNSGSGLSSASGIGLTICKELVNAMGGTLYVKSTLGSGSTFTFKLKTLGFSNGPSTQPIPFLPPSLRGSPPPLPPPRSWIEPKLSPSSSEEKTGAFTAPLAPGRLVLAEDDEMNRVVISMFLEGHTVTEAHNGLEAIVSVYRELQSQQGVDLVVMDINMPLLTGRQASQLIRLMQFGVSPWAAHIPIIALTANAMDSDLRRCLNAGMTTCLTKPVPLEMLLRLVRSSLRNCRQTDFQGEEVQVPDEDQKTHIEAMLPLIREVVALTVAALVHGVGVRLDMPERVESLSGCLAWCLRLLGNEEGASKIDEAMGQGEEETELRLKALAVECGQEWLNFSSYGGP